MPLARLAKTDGGERGIRTLDTHNVYTLSRRAPSATRPSLQCAKVYQNSAKKQIKILNNKIYFTSKIYILIIRLVYILVFFRMIIIIKKIINGLHRGARRAKEIGYDFINFFGAGLSLSHFSKEDLKKHEQWYAKPQLKKLLESVTRFPDKTLRYFQIKLISTNIYEPEYKFKPHDNSYIDYKGNELLYSNAKNILVEIDKYVARINHKKSFLTEMLSADQDKMTPDLMVLSFIAEYIENELINYKNDPEELQRIDGLITYLSRLAGIDNIKADRHFLHTILSVRSQLAEARKKLTENISRTASVTTIGLIENLTRTIAGDLSRFLTSVVEFNRKQENYAKWNALLQSLLTKDLIVNAEDIAKYAAELERIIESTCDYNDDPGVLTAICPAFIEQKRVDQKVAVIIKKLHELIITAISLFQIMRYINTEVHISSAGHLVSVEQVKDVLFQLQMIMEDIKQQLQLCYEWRGYFDKYCESHENTDAVRPCFDAITSAAELIVNNIDILFSKIRLYRDSVSMDHACETSPNSHVAQMLKTFFKHMGAQGKCKSVVSREIKEFINSLRNNGLFSKDIAVILGEYFYIENTTKPDGVTVISQKVTHLKSVSTTEPIAHEYLSVLLSIVIKIHKHDFSRLDKLEDSTKTTIISKLVDFIIKNLVLYDPQAIKLLFTTLLEQTSLAVSLEERNKRLKELIHDHVSSIKENIMNMISYNSRMFQLKLPEYSDFIGAVIVFVKNVLIKVDRSKEIFFKLRAKSILAEDYASVDSISNALQDLEAALKENNEVSQLLIASVSALTSVSTSVVYLEQECQIIETGKPAIRDQNEQEIGVLLQALEQERIELQANTENLKSRIQDIKAYADETNDEILRKVRGFVQDLLMIYDGLSQFALIRHHAFSALKGVDIVFEFAAAKYMHVMICHILSNNLGNKDDYDLYMAKFQYFVLLLKEQDNYSQFFTVFINNIHLAVAKVVTSSQIVRPALVTTWWRSSGLLVSVKKVDNLQHKIESDMDACFPRGFISL